MLKSDFFKDILTLMTGTSVAQAIPIAISPILTRLYSPEDFGLFALYMSISSIIAVVATGRYEMAIMLPKSDNQAKNIVALSMFITSITSLFLFIFILLFNRQLTELFQNEEISIWLYFIPFSILISGFYNSIIYWLNRKKSFKEMSICRVSQSSMISANSLTFGIINLSSIGLIISSFVGNLLALIVSFKMIKNQKFYEFISYRKMIVLAKRYIKFPKYDIFATMCNVASHRIGHILFNMLFNASISGYYYLTQRMFGVPITLIASAITDVFKEKITREYNNKADIVTIYLKALVLLALLAIVPTLILYFYAIEIFTFFFGDAWQVAGEFAKILVPMLFFRFISTPLSYVFYLAHKQHHNVVGQFTLLLLVFVSFFFGKDYGYEYIVYLLSISFSLFYISYILLSYIYVKKLYSEYKD